MYAGLFSSLYLRLVFAVPLFIGLFATSYGLLGAIDFPNAWLGSHSPERLAKRWQLIFRAKAIAFCWQIASFLFGVYIIFYDESAKADVIYGYSEAAMVYMELEIAYLLYDSRNEYIKLRLLQEEQQKCGGGNKKGNKLWDILLMSTHHLVTLLVLCVPYIRGMGHFFVGNMAMGSSAAVLVHMRWFMWKLGMENTFRYLVVGSFMIGVWFLFRLCLFPMYGILAFARQRDITLWDVPLHISPWCSIGTLSFFILNVYWFWRMCRSAIVRMRTFNAGGVGKVKQ